MTSAFDLAAANLQNQSLIQVRSRRGEGVRWADQSECLSCAVAKFFRPGYENNLVNVGSPPWTESSNGSRTGFALPM